MRSWVILFFLCTFLPTLYFLLWAYINFEQSYTVSFSTCKEDIWILYIHNHSSISPLDGSIITINIYSYTQRRQWQLIPVLLPGKSHGRRSLVGCSPWGHEESDMAEQLHFHALEKEMATHSSVLAWRIPGMGEPGGLPSMESHRVGDDWSDTAAAAYIHTHMSDYIWIL